MCLGDRAVNLSCAFTPADCLGNGNHVSEIYQVLRFEYLEQVLKELVSNVLPHALFARRGSQTRLRHLTQSSRNHKLEVGGAQCFFFGRFWNCEPV